MIQFQPAILLDAATPIPEHALVAFAAAALGAVQLVLPKGTGPHRAVGWAFVAAMAFVAVSGAFISNIHTWGYFSPIHLLVPFTLVMLWRGVVAARRGDIRAHRGRMTGLFIFALVVTGAFTFWPGRIMHQVVFGPPAVAQEGR